MVKIGSAAAVAVSLALVAAPGASAQLTLDTPPLCTDFDDFVANGATPVSYAQCGGAFSGNTSNQDVEGWILANWGLDVALDGSTDPNDDSGVFGDANQFSQGSTAGTLNFTPGVEGVFVLALKANGHFSLYQFATAGGTWTSLTYGTEGTALNAQGVPEELSHASVYSATTVPEPGTVVLLLTALPALALAARRRRNAAE